MRSLIFASHNSLTVVDLAIVLKIMAKPEFFACRNTQLKRVEKDVGGGGFPLSAVLGLSRE